MDWYPWSEASFEKARKEETPVFLLWSGAGINWYMDMERIFRCSYRIGDSEFFLLTCLQALHLRCFFV
ncbi:hypothetical protein [Marinithermofilum abyssi]|uniref:hypothetical protein n=1 Tax=Marinithermofilum abyssi TaxID=1571185 RepID=UPI0035709DC7